MNYYEILRVPKNASNQQIKNSYKKLVKQYHPDLYVGDKDFAEQKIKEINEAYDILSNSEKKSEYDEYLNSLVHSTQVYSSAPSPRESSSVAPNPTPDSHPENFFTKFITEKLNKLDKKRQLQIFILFFIVILSLFLINLIQVQYYLTNENNNVSHPTYDFHTENVLENNTFYIDENLKTLDDLFNELFAPYLNETYYENYTF